MSQGSDRPARGRVLLVDDPGFFRDFVGHAFSSAGFEVSIVDNEMSAKTALDAEAFDLLALEVRMAHLDAEFFVAALKAEPRHEDLAVLGLSERGLGRKDLTALRRAGFNAFISKLAPEEHLVFRARTILHPRDADSRDHERIAVSLPVRWRAGGISAWSRTLTLSAGGLFVRTDTPPPVGTSAWVHFGLPDSNRTIDVEGVVVHVVQPGADMFEPGGFGLRFAGLKAEDREALQAHVEREAELTPA